MESTIIRTAEFSSLENLNKFIGTDNTINIISIETVEYEYDTGLPRVKGGTLKTKKEKIKVWYYDSI
jgi:hypothetical protein